MPTIYNDHNVYILGAGFSAARGLPLISNFMFCLRDAHEWLVQQGRTREAQSVERVLQFRLESTPTSYRVQIDLENIEELFSLAAAVGNSLTADIRNAIAATLDFCLSTNAQDKTILDVRRGETMAPAVMTGKALQKVMGQSTEQYELPTYQFVVAGLIGALDEKDKAGNNAFVTFNYDLLVEEALTALHIPFSYGFLPGSVSFDSSTRSVGLSDEASLKVLKLHGSTNWAVPGFQDRKLTVFRSYDDVRAGEMTPELVPPTWRKSFDGALSHVWQEGLREIRKATRIVIIGFSAPRTDLHFKFLFAAGLRENISLREIVFVNTNRAEIEARANELFGDLNRRPIVRIVETQATNFVGQGAFDSNSSAVGRSLHKSIERVLRFG